MQLLIEIFILMGFVLAIMRPVWLFYVLIFILLEPSRNLSLGNYILGGINIKYYELVMFLLFFGAVVNRQRPVLPCIRFSLLLFMLFALLSLAQGFGPYGQGAFNQFRPFASLGMCVAVPLLFRRPDEIKPLVQFFAVAMVVAGSIDFLEVLHMNPLSAWVQSGYRTMSVLGGTQGSMLAMIFLYGLAVNRYIARHRVLAMAMMAYAGLLAVLCGSRGVWLGMIGGVIGLVWFLPFQRKVAMLTTVALLTLFVAVFLKSFYIERYDMPILERFRTLLDPNEGTARWRMDAWWQMAEDIRERPFLGWPFGSESSFYVFSGGYYEQVAPHNEYLKIARYTGLCGLGVFLWFIGGAFLSGCRYVSRHTGDRQGAEILGIVLCLLLHTVVSGVTQQFTTIDISPIIWALPGIITLYLITERDVPLPGSAQG